MHAFLDLPTELILQILSEVDPIDILRLTQVCRLARAIASGRSVWEQALQCLYRRNSLFKPSFPPFSSMDMDGLKKAAMRPYQVQSKLSKSSATANETLYHVRDRALAIDELRMEDFIRVQIIPGGRYVVGLADTLLCLWDIGPPGTEPKSQAAVLLDTVRLESDEFFSISNPTQSSNDAFRFAVYIHEGQELNQRVHVYEVGPLEGDHRLRLIGELHLNGDASLSRFWVSGDRVFLYRGTGLFVVWDFVSRSLSSWRLILGMKRLSCELIDVGNVVISLQRDELLAWKIPFLRAIQGHPGLLDASFEVVNQPFTHIPFPRSWRTAGSGSTKILLPSRWNPFTHTPITVDIVYALPIRMLVRLTRLRIRVSANEDEVHVTLVSTGESVELERLWSTAGVRPYSTLGNGLYVAGRVPMQPDSESIVVHYSSFDSELDVHGGRGGGGEERTEWRTLDCPVDHAVDTCSMICPYSGRFAYLCQYGHEDGCNRIHVVDLLD